MKKISVTEFVHFLKRENVWHTFKKDYLYHPNGTNKKNIFENIESACKCLSPLNSIGIGFYWHETEHADLWRQKCEMLDKENKIRYGNI